MAEQLAELNKSQSTSYSTTEVMTGETWIDGKPIYRRVFSVPAISGGSGGTVASISGIIPINYGGYFTISGAMLPVCTSGRRASSSQLPDAVMMYYDGAGIKIQCGSERNLTGGYLIVDYIKTT